MSPALAASASLPATINTGSLSPPHIPQWRNPYPQGWKELDEKRKFCLQAEHKQFLEMHPNGTRGVNTRTKYCLLTILILNITGVSLNDDDTQQQLNWKTKGNEKKTSYWRKESTKHVIMGTETKLFLCMNDRSVVYQSPDFNVNHCVFDNEITPETYMDRYSRKVNDSTPRWYIGMNKDGSMRCGNVTRKNYRGANFNKLEIKNTSTELSSPSPPFKGPNKECCTDKSCKPQRKGRKCRYKNWCRKHRRRFFKLTLKELRRYYKRCVKSNKRRHCRSNKKERKSIDR